MIPFLAGISCNRYYALGAALTYLRLKLRTQARCDSRLCYRPLSDGRLQNLRRHYVSDQFDAPILLNRVLKAHSIYHHYSNTQLRLCQKNKSQVRHAFRHHQYGHRADEMEAVTFE